MRGLIFEDTLPPREPVEPREPIPDFTHMVHSTVRWCGWDRGKYGEADRGHMYSAMPYMERVKAWKLNQLHGDGSLTLKWVEEGPGCPHCAAEKHHADKKVFKAEKIDHDRQVALHERFTTETAKPRRKRGLKV